MDITNLQHSSWEIRNDAEDWFCFIGFDSGWRDGVCCFHIAIAMIYSDDLLELCSKNTLYYEYCPPFVSHESIEEDMNAIPPENKLLAVLDLIDGYPDRNYLMFSKNMDISLFN